MLKSAIAEPSKWLPWGKNEQDGLFVLDIDYCAVADEVPIITTKLHPSNSAVQECPEDMQCQREGPGLYACVCTNPTHVAVEVPVAARRGDPSTRLACSTRIIISMT